MRLEVWYQLRGGCNSIVGIIKGIGAAVWGEVLVNGSSSDVNGLWEIV
jgi:hypothetical protein